MPISGDARLLLILSVHRVPTLTRPSFLGNGTTARLYKCSDNDEFGLLRSSNLGTVVAYITYLPDQVIRYKIYVVLDPFCETSSCTVLE